MNKRVITEKIVGAIRSCKNALSLQDDPFIVMNREALAANLREIASSHCDSWIGYHARIYYRNFSPPTPGDHFSSEWGFQGAFSNPTSQNWVEYAPEAVEMAAMSGVDPAFKEKLASISKRAEDTFAESQDTVLTIAELLLDQEPTSSLERLRDKIKGLDGRILTEKVIKAVMPTGSFWSRDSTAMSQGVVCPPHTSISAEQVARSSPFTALNSLVKASNSLIKYMEIHEMADRSTMQKMGKVFIGHGRSSVWRELKDFLQDRLGLPWDEFNRESTAGVATVARLQQMLEEASFAFLLMTAEDEHADASLHARENVIHEVGLFQGRLGFNKAIVILENGCVEFSNVAGLGQIRFPAGNISSKFEEIRLVLEREGMI